MDKQKRRVARQYLQAIERNCRLGIVTERSHYWTLQELIEALDPSVSVVSEPSRIECGAPDFLVVRGSRNVGHIEAKDVGENLDRALQSEQVQRYLDSLDNLVITNYLEFRWFTAGSLQESARIASFGRDGRIVADADGLQQAIGLLSCFLSYRGESVGTPRELAKRMAYLAHMVRDLILEVFRAEGENGSLHNQMQAFKSVLVPDLTPEQFADMYAQTITYGLFAARTRVSGEDFARAQASFNIPPTNPFLQQLFHHIAGPQLDPRVAWLVDDLTELLARIDMEAILDAFSRSTRQEDPVVHFYETFLRAYDPKIREIRGVYFTPEPVVSYIVTSVDHVLREQFGRPEGLADPGVFVLDPAVGTGTFLFHAIKLIHRRLEERGQATAWDGYVSNHLLRRIFGFELLMAPYAVAHLKLGLLLQEMGYSFPRGKRLGVYLTNTLEEAVAKSQVLFANFIAEEANEAARIKREVPIEVVIGNPPWAGHSANASYREVVDRATGKRQRLPTWIGRLIQDYLRIEEASLGERNPKWLQDDYVKFLRFAQWRIEQTGRGIVGMVTNHGYLDNPTFRGMRHSLAQAFTDIYVLDLHGNARKRERAPDGQVDQNVFDIQQGVAICLLVKDPRKQAPAAVRHAELWGSRERKHEILSSSSVATTDWECVCLAPRFFLFKPHRASPEDEYQQGWSLADIFPVHSVGVVTARDRLTIGFTPEEVYERVQCFASLPEEEARREYELGKDVQDWKVSSAQTDLRSSGPQKDLVVPILYRPFDVRYTYYTGRSQGFICRPRPEVMRHLLGKENLGIVVPRRVETAGGWHHVLATKYIAEHVVVSAKTIDYVFPLYLYGSSHPADNQVVVEFGRQANLSEQFVDAASRRLGLRFVAEGRGDQRSTFGPEDVFCYVYAILHSPSYREQYSELLCLDFPRIPLTSDPGVFAALTDKGQKLVGLHQMSDPELGRFVTRLGPRGRWEVTRVAYDESARRVYVNGGQFFEGVEPDVWNFRIGGYRPLEKWLKDRKGRVLEYDDLQHYQRMVVAVRETVRLMEEIEALVPSCVNVLEGW